MGVSSAQERIVSAVSKWEGVTAEPHRFGGTEFRVGRREIGHIHGDLWADIPFPMQVRNQLLQEQKAEPHHILPESGWVTFRIREDRDVERAIELFKQSYDLATAKVKVAPS
jgi:hypothetical protein